MLPSLCQGELVNELPETTAKRLFREQWEHLSSHEREVIEAALA